VRMAYRITEADNKIISQLVYLNIDDAGSLSADYKYSQKLVSVNDLILYYTTDSEGIAWLKERFRTKDPKSENGYHYDEYHEWSQFLKSDELTKYRDWKITNVESDNQKEGSGFVAYTFEPEKGQAVVAFRGSEPLEDPFYRNDWDNNLTSIYALETRQQLKAKEYMEKYAEQYDQLTLTGHSLGGNLALYATITADSHIKEKIVTTDTFNAPGFNKEFLTSHKEELAKVTSKIREFQNKYDAVSSLLYNPTTPIIIDTLFKKKKSIALENHGLAYLMVDENGMFKRSVPQEKDFFSRWLEHFTQGLEQLPNFQLEGFVTTILAVWDGRVSMMDFLKLEHPSNGQLSQFAKAMVVIGVISYLVTLNEIIEDWIHEQLQQWYQQLEDYFQELFSQIGTSLSNELIRSIYQELHQVFKRIADGVRELWGIGGAAYNSEIHVDLIALRNIASRLKAVQTKVQRVDRRLQTLSTLVDFEERFSVSWVGLRSDYEQDVYQCVRYVVNAIESFKDCESRLLQKARTF